MNSKCFIYVIRHPLTNTIVYVGQTTKGRARFVKHLNSTKKQPISQWIQKIKQEGQIPFFEPIFYPIQSNIDEMEIYYISHYREQGLSLKNLTSGGKSTRGFKMPNEVVEKARQRLIGKPSLRKGIPMSEEAKSKMSIAAKKRTGSLNHFTGKKHTKETRIKMSLNGKGKVPHNKTKVLFVNTGEIFESTVEAAKALNIPRSLINESIRGLHKNRRGLVFKAVEV